MVSCITNLSLRKIMKAFDEFRASLPLRLLLLLPPASAPCGAQRCHNDQVLDHDGYHALSCGGVGNQRAVHHNTALQTINPFAR
jgi:hypothetical protein